MGFQTQIKWCGPTLCGTITLLPTTTVSDAAPEASRKNDGFCKTLLPVIFRFILYYMRAKQIEMKF